MTHILDADRITSDMNHFEHFKRLASMSAAHVEVALGADEAKRFEADIAKCVKGNGDVASKSERLQVMKQAMFARINAQLKEEGGGTAQLAQQLEACTAAANTGHADIWNIDKLSDGEKKKALEVALRLAAQYTRELYVTSGNNTMLSHTLEFLEQEKLLCLRTIQKLATFADSTKASLDAANEASARSESALRKANERIAQLEKEASKTGERIAQAVCDMQKLVYKKEDTDRTSWSSIQQKPAECLERTVQALKRTSEAKGADANAPNCKDCPTLKAKMETLQKENAKLLDDKAGLLEDRQRGKDDVKTLTEQLAKLRAENTVDKPKKRNK